MTGGGLCLDAVIQGQGPHPVQVRLAVRQLGATSYFGFLGGGLVVKFLKVDDLRRALRAAEPGPAQLREPHWSAPLRRAPLPDNPFRPDRSRLDRVRAGHDRVLARIGAVTPAAADAALRHTVRLDARDRERLVSAAFATRTVLGFAPEPSQVTVADFPGLGVTGVPALLQQDVGHRTARLAPTEGPATVAALALLLCLAQLTADLDGVGLDLVPRPTRHGLLFPNVLVRHGGGGPAYIDFFGLGDPHGPLVERFGHHALYGGLRPVAALATRTAAILAARLTPTGACMTAAPAPRPRPPRAPAPPRSGPPTAPGSGPDLDRISSSRRIYRRINRLLSPVAFSTTLEDLRTIDTALHLAPAQRVVCLASAGDIPLALLSRAPSQVAAVDICVAQLHLTELKRTAAALLPYDRFRTLLGPGPGATATYDELRSRLPPATRSFWDDNLAMIDAGVRWQGAVHRLAATARPLWQLLTRRAPHRAALLSPRPADGAVPLPCVGPNAYPAVTAYADRLLLVHADIRRHLRGEPAASIDRFALSNVHDWLTPTGWHALLTEVVRTAKPDARVLAASRHRRIRLPADLATRFRPDARLQHALLAADRVRYFRSFAVLTVCDRSALR